MKSLILILALLATPVAAQSPLPRTVPWTDGKGERIGTATFAGAHMYLRNLNGEHVATVVIDAHGSTLYDPSGKVLDHRGPGQPPTKP